MSDSRIGTSGWNYPTGKGTWNGIFYPVTRGSKRGAGKFDEERFMREVAPYFDTSVSTRVAAN